MVTFIAGGVFAQEAEWGHFDIPPLEKKIDTEYSVKYALQVSRYLDDYDQNENSLFGSTFQSEGLSN